MRLLAVLAKSRVTKMSLCASGMPSSAPDSPRARRASAARACASVASGRTSRNAFRRLLAAARARNSCASSTAETFFACRSWLSTATDACANSLVSLMRALCRGGTPVARRSVAHAARAAFARSTRAGESLDHLGHKKKPAMLSRRIFHTGVALVLDDDRVRAQALHAAQRVRHRLDPGGVDLLHLRDHREDVVQLRQRRLCLLGSDINASQMRDAVHVGEGEGHPEVGDNSAD